MSDDKLKKEAEEEAFRRYREQMHGSDDDDDDRRHTPGAAMRTVFGLIMIIVYVGMGVLCMINWFGYEQPVATMVCRWIVGPALIIYGVWRAYRQFAGIDSRF